MSVPDLQPVHVVAEVLQVRHLASQLEHWVGEVRYLPAVQTHVEPESSNPLAVLHVPQLVAVELQVAQLTSQSEHWVGEVWYFPGEQTQVVPD